MRHRTGLLKGVSNTLIFTQHWLPNNGAIPRANIVIAHGIGEHSDRYIHVAERLVKRGYGVFALDHRGHGRSEGERVIVSDFVDTYVADLRAYVDEIQAAYPDTPLFLYGHSMGSLIALLFAFRYQDELAGLITTGTALKPVMSNTVTVPILKTASSLIPGARLIPLDVSAISRDPEVCRTYQHDPLVYHGRIPLITLAALQEAANLCIKYLPDLHVPYLAMHGREDQLTMVKGAHIILERSGSRDTMVKIYDGLYHEIHNEPEQEQVFEDMLYWLDKHTA
jgi:lysophospholipase